jgi:hypothetical protein
MAAKTPTTINIWAREKLELCFSRWTFDEALGLGFEVSGAMGFLVLGFGLVGIVRHCYYLWLIMGYCGIKSRFTV